MNLSKHSAIGSSIRATHSGLLSMCIHTPVKTSLGHHYLFFVLQKVIYPLYHKSVVDTMKFPAFAIADNNSTSWRT
jgi:hypothetical protein